MSRGRGGHSREQTVISEPTREQLAALNLDITRPLMICDVDEVVVHFLRDFETFAAEQGYRLDASSHNWGANLTTIEKGAPISKVDSGNLIDLFFSIRTKHMEAIEGAVPALLEIGRHADVVLLTNLPHWAGEDRRHNMVQHGLPFPVVTNSGPKGPAIRQLSASRSKPVVFVDDSPHFVQSANEHAPHVKVVHFLQDHRARSNVSRFDFVWLHATNWREIKHPILSIMQE